MNTGRLDLTGCVFFSLIFLFDLFSFFFQENQIIFTFVAAIADEHILSICFILSLSVPLFVCFTDLAFTLAT